MKNGFLKAECFYEMQRFNNQYNFNSRKHFIEGALEYISNTLEDIFNGYRVVYKIKYDENYKISEYTKLTIEEIKKLVMLL